MNKFDVQRLLAAVGYYKGAIDGDIGKGSLAAIDKALKRYPTTAKWSDKRRLIGAGQAVLTQLGYNAGSVDGYLGNMTIGALLQWSTKTATGAPLKLDQTPIRPAPIATNVFPPQSQCGTFYGEPGLNQIKARLVTIELPVVLRIDYNLSQTVRKMTLHRKCADSAVKAYEEIVRHYGEAKFKKLGLDRFAGSYNHRKMRGGNSWSMHAYGCAIDHYAAPNGLTIRCPKALFCGEEYKAFFDIWESVGWTSLGRAIGRDWMHVQAARL